MHASKFESLIATLNSCVDGFMSHVLLEARGVQSNGQLVATIHPRFGFRAVEFLEMHSGQLLCIVRWYSALQQDIPNRDVSCI